MMGKSEETGRARGLRTIVGLALGVAAFAAAAETVTVSDVTSLTNELDRLNRLSTAAGKDLGHVVRLAPGAYDVSDCHMLCDVADSEYNYTQSRSHLAVAQVTLEGTTANARDTVIYGDASDRLIYAYGGLVRNLTLSNGCVNALNSVQTPAANASGGGISCRNESTYLENCVVTCCRAPNGEGGGAAVLCEARSCLFVGNSAESGGALGNCCKGPKAAATGGATNCTFIGNVATVRGGAVMNTALEDCHVISNRCVTFGGGVFNNHGGRFVRHTDVMYNFAEEGGGGVYAPNNVISNCLIACNSVVSTGGGVYCAAAVYDTVISNNVSAGVYHDSPVWAGGAGGVIYAKLYTCEIVDNATTGVVNSASSCGCGGVRESTASNCVIVGNSTTYCGGGAHRSTLIDCIVSNNTAQCYGGGVYGSALGGNAPMVVIGGKVVMNKVESHRSDMKVNQGGGGYRATFTNVIVSGNAVVESWKDVDGNGGGGFGCDFVGCEVSYNYAHVGAAAYGGTMKKCSVHDNASSSATYLIRGVYDIEDCDIAGQTLFAPGRVVNTRIHDFDARGYTTFPEGVNVATNGTFSWATDMSLFYCKYTSAATPFAMTNCLVWGNYISHMYCGADAANNQSIVNCIVVSNRWDWQFYNLHRDGSNLELVNSIFQGNLNRAGTAKRNFWSENADQQYTISHCIFEGTPDVGNTVNDGIRFWKDDAVATQTGVTVRFDTSAPPDWPYQPAYGSVARGKGLVQDWMTAARDIRQDVRYPRLRDGRVDVGCYQNWTIPTGAVIMVR